ncbi:hypothetical protein PHYPSEUDO_008701 [Phytophthora pseudosyringae]|uniref:Uncharacterized protein n=1 Tax=Phytophthora pseudosyringae TaxID=221518 RepID=A0A8T1VE03_9STRA|nr:hypothetical protein PHYPSEUDO_008701 [Phytophthora pseudosyringae]
MDSDSDEDVLTYRRVAREMLDVSRLKRLHGDWGAASWLRHHGLALLYASIPRFSLPVSDLISTASPTTPVYSSIDLHAASYAAYKLRLSCRMSSAPVPTPVRVTVASKSCSTVLPIRIGGWRCPESTVDDRVL